MKDNRMRTKSPTARRDIAGNVKDNALLEQRRREVVAAATAVFLKSGFHKASVRDIAEAVGVSQGSLYNYVRTKEDILYLICENAVSAYSADVRQAVESAVHPQDQLEQAVRATIVTMLNHRDEILIVYRDSHSLDPQSRKIVLNIAASFVKLLASIIEVAMDEGHIPRADPMLAANTVIHLATIFALRGWSFKPTPPDQVVSFLVGFAMAGLKGNGAASR